MRLFTLSLVTIAAVLGGSASAGPESATRTEVLAETCAVPVDGEGGCCDEYYACIDACAESFHKATSFCDATYKAGSAEHAGCTGLADHNYETCLKECEPRPEGC